MTERKLTIIAWLVAIGFLAHTLLGVISLITWVLR